MSVQKESPFFHKVRGIEQSLIQQVFKDVDEQYILSMKNCTTGQFTGNISQILRTYGRISLSRRNKFEKEVIEIHYDAVTPAGKNLNKIEDLLEYGKHGRLYLFTPSVYLQGL